MRLKQIGLAVSLGLLVAFGQPWAYAESASVADAPTGAVKYTEVEGISEYRLPNGLKVLLAPDLSKPTATVNMTYLVGSRNENYGETGMAHLLEHLVFKGTPTHQNIPQDLSKRGMRPNGTTSNDRTNYFETFAASDDNIEWALRMEADRMVNSFVAKKDLDSEMTVVRNEMERGENSPGRVLWEKMLASAYQWHNYGKTTIGARADVENVNIERLQDFYRKYYQPDNAVLVVSGKFEPTKVLNWVQQYFGVIPKPTRTIEPTYTLDPAQDGAREVTLQRVGDSQILAALYHGPAGAHPDFAPLVVLTHVLGDTPSGRLHKALVESKKAAGVDGEPVGLREPGYVLFSADLRKQDAIADVRRVFLEMIEGVGKKPVSEQEVQIAKSSMLNDFEKILNDPTRLGVSLSEAIAKGDWRLFFLFRDRVEAVTAADVNRVALNYLKTANRTLGQFIPTEKPERAEIPATPPIADMVKDYKGKAAVATGEVFDPSPANIDARTLSSRLPNGMKLALLPKKTRGETVSFSFNLHFGDEKTLFGKRTLSSFTRSMLLRGTSKHTRQALQIEFDRLKTHLAIGGEGQVVSVGAETTRENLPAVLKLVREVLREPVFPKEEFAQLQKQALTDLESSKSQPDSIAQREMGRHFNGYPKGDVRYTGTFDEDVGEIKAVALPQVKRFYVDFYGADHAQFGMVGDFDAKEMEVLLKDLFGDWKSKAAYTRVPSPYREVKAANLKQETPDKQNAIYLSGMNLPLGDSSADYPALVLGNYMLGGGFLNSRLATRLRQKEGVSYSVGSSLTASADEPVGSFSGYAIYAPQNREKVMTGFKEELARALKDGFSEQEVAEAKSGLLQASQLRRSQDGSLSGTLAAYQRLGRSMAFVADFEEKLKALQPADVLAAMQKYIDPAKLTQVYAGDFAKAEKK